MPRVVSTRSACLTTVSNTQLRWDEIPCVAHIWSRSLVARYSTSWRRASRCRVAVSRPGTSHPERVVKQAIVNAVIHRDYRLNRDIFVRIFDDRIEVDKPAPSQARITPGNIGRAGSKARNPLIAQNLREFPVAPNIDAGEGVKMMFAEMAAAKLFPPQYSQNTGSAVESVMVTLLNLERPSAWDEVSAWIDREDWIRMPSSARLPRSIRLKRRRC